VLAGCRPRGQAKAEAGGCPDRCCEGDRSVHRVVHPLALVPIVLVRIHLAAMLPVFLLVLLLVWSEKKQAGARKGVPWAEPHPQRGRAPGLPASAVLPVNRWVDHELGRPVDRREASGRSETVAWVRTEPRVPVAHPRLSLAVMRSAFPPPPHPAPRHRSFAGLFFPHLAPARAGNCAKDTQAEWRLVFPPVAVSSTPC